MKPVVKTPDFQAMSHQIVGYIQMVAASHDGQPMGYVLLTTKGSQPKESSKEEKSVVELSGLRGVFPRGEYLQLDKQLLQALSAHQTDL
ncbi:Uncharacterised protein [Escherichia coli]|uniref:Uncharacterized protein n=1 Tax=Escherichia coli TaxID=562 RepID=A0A376VXJ7_ECOLX|nr:Uncharacterised protein [Escherichia coli]